MIVALYVVVGRAYPQRLQPAVLACFSAAWVLPAIVGPLVSGTVTEHLGWRWVFLVHPGAGAAAARGDAAGPAGQLPDGRRSPVMNRRRILLALAVAAGAGLLQYAGQDLAWRSLLAGRGRDWRCWCRASCGCCPRGTFRAARGLPSVVLLRGVAAGTFLARGELRPADAGHPAGAVRRRWPASRSPPAG